MRVNIEDFLQFSTAVIAQLYINYESFKAESADWLNSNPSDWQFDHTSRHDLAISYTEHLPMAMFVIELGIAMTRRLTLVLVGVPIQSPVLVGLFLTTASLSSSGGSRALSNVDSDSSVAYGCKSPSADRCFAVDVTHPPVT